MPAFFIHGVPETHHLWTPLIDQLPRDDVVAVDLPEFGSSVPVDFTAINEAYVDWLIGRIEHIGEPVDIVAHDWGCILAVRVASLRSDLVPTLAGGGGAVSRDYEWHALAKMSHTCSSRWFEPTCSMAGLSKYSRTVRPIWVAYFCTTHARIACSEASRIRRCCKGILGKLEYFDT